MKLFLFPVFLSLFRVGLCGLCVLHNGSNDTRKLALFDRISLLNGQKFVTERGGYSYAVAICGDASKGHHPAASATKTNIAANTTVVIGRRNDTDIVGEDSWLLLTYASGDRIVENGSCNGTSWKTLVLITCGTKSDDINLEILADVSAGCFAMFHLKNTLLCPAPKGLGPGTVLLVLLLTGLLCYLLVGVAYRRIIAGAKGMEQIPNYQFWCNLLSTPYNLVRRREDRSRDGDWRSSRPEAVDEPLLSP